MVEVVLDASAILSVLFREPGGEKVLPHLNQALVSALNYSEVIAHATKLCGDGELARRHVDRHQFSVVPFDKELALASASMLPQIRPFGLSLASRSCLALGLSRQAPVLTADRNWAKLPLDIRIELIR